LDVPNFVRSESSAADESDRVEPKLRDVNIPFNVDMRRLFTVTSIKNVSSGESQVSVSSKPTKGSTGRYPGGVGI
jgi:hypothetical protein